MAKFAIAIQGSRGDFQPFLALALGLRNAGHEVKIFTGEGHCKSAAEFGIEATVACMEVKDILNSEAGKKAMETGDLAAAAGEMNDGVDWWGPFSKAMDEFHPDVLLYTALIIDMALRYIQEKRPDLPAFHGGLQPQIVPSDEYPPIALARVESEEGQPHMSKWFMLLQSTVDTVIKASKDIQDAGLEVPLSLAPEYAFKEMFDYEEHPCPLLMAYSEAFWPAPADWPKEGIKILGRFSISKEDQEKTAKAGNSSFFDEGSELQRCADFIKAGSKPIYMGWGSMTVKTKEYMAIIAVEALQHAGQRGIVVSGWADVSADSLDGAANAADLKAFAKENVFFMKSAPHEWLFPQCAACVHHGGIGTAQASLAAGSPTIVTPVFADQFDIATRITAQGWGLGTTKLTSVSSKELGDCISKVVKDDTILRNVQALAAKMEKEDGVKAAVEYFTGFIEKELKSGEWLKKHEAYLGKVKEWRTKNLKFSMERIVMSFQGNLNRRYPSLKDWNAKVMSQYETMALLARAGKLFWVKGTSCLARASEKLKSDEVGRFKEFAMLELVEQKGSRLHVKRLKGIGPDSGWVSAEVGGKEIVAKAGADEIGKIEVAKFVKLFSDIR